MCVRWKLVSRTQPRLAVERTAVPLCARRRRTIFGESSSSGQALLSPPKSAAVRLSVYILIYPLPAGRRGETSCPRARVGLPSHGPTPAPFMGRDNARETYSQGTTPLFLRRLRRGMSIDHVLGELGDCRKRRSLFSANDMSDGFSINNNGVIYSCLGYVLQKITNCSGRTKYDKTAKEKKM